MQNQIQGLKRAAQANRNKTKSVISNNKQTKQSTGSYGYDSSTNVQQLAP